MRTLFSELSIGGLRLPHRIVVSPMCQYVAHDSVAGDWHLAVGSIAEPAQAEAVIATGQAEQVALARPFLADPRWVWRAAETLGVAAYCPPSYRRAAGLRKPPVAA